MRMRGGAHWPFYRGPVMATANITIRDADTGSDTVLAIEFKDGFDETSPAHQLAADLATEMTQEDHKND